MQAGFCEPYLASAQIAPFSQLHQPLFLQHPQIAPERAAIEPHGVGEQGNARLTEPLHMTQQGKLRGTKPDGREGIVVTAGDATAGAAQLEALSKSPRPPLVAFIGYDNDLRIDADSRAYDYTPRRDGGEAAQLDVIPGRRNGGADAFLDLLQQQVVPRVEAMAPVDGGRRALWGHSYGGVLVLHALFTRPDAFSTFAAADPSLWWGRGRLLEEEQAAAPWPAPAPTLLLWVGEGAPDRHPPPPGRNPAALALASLLATMQVVAPMEAVFAWSVLLMLVLSVAPFLGAWRARTRAARRS